MKRVPDGAQNLREKHSAEEVAAVNASLARSLAQFAGQATAPDVTRDVQ